MTIDGKDVQKDPEEAKRAIGYLPELPPLYVDMTVREYLEFVAELKKVPKKERKQQIDEVMEMTQISRYAAASDQESVKRLQAESRTGAGNPRLSGGHYSG